MTTVIGVTCQYSMIYLPAYLHLCESAEALFYRFRGCLLQAIPNLEACYLYSLWMGPCFMNPIMICHLILNE